jgi:hypothetical protein
MPGFSLTCYITIRYTVFFTWLAFKGHQSFILQVIYTLFCDQHLVYLAHLGSFNQLVGEEMVISMGKGMTCEN